MASNEDDLQASKTEGYKLGEKKTVEEYAKLGRSMRCPGHVQDLPIRHQW